MRTVILFDPTLIDPEGVAQHAAALLAARQRVRIVALPNIQPTDFEEAGLLLTHCSPAAFAPEVAASYQAACADGLRIMPLDVPLTAPR